MNIEFDPYIILGVSPEATIDDLKSAYRRAARRLHPDVNPNNPGAGVQFQDVTAAYEVLIDPNRRRSFDRGASRQQSSSLQFSLRVTPSKRSIVSLKETQVVYLLLEILPDPRGSDKQFKRESQVNLTLVLDRSNSMSGTRLEKVKVAAHQIIDQLTPQDVFSVVSFNDFAETVIAATSVTDKPALKARVSMMNASGGTEIYKGLLSGVDQNRRYLAPRMVNHIILLTDGYTYGDHERSLNLARAVAKEGISISAMGLGQDWNDVFLDELASVTGGTTRYINSASAVVRFLNDHVRNLSNVFAERLQLSVAPDPDIKLESVFKLSPNPQPLSAKDPYIPLGSLQVGRPISILLQLELPANMGLGFRSIARVVAYGDLLTSGLQKHQSVSDLSLDIVGEPVAEDPPPIILDALGKLTLYRMQERAQEALEKGDVKEATRRLENLATRLLEIGEEDLARQARAEAQQVAYTNTLSDKGRKTLKYQTRFLLMGSSAEERGE